MARVRYTDAAAPASHGERVSDSRLAGIFDILRQYAERMRRHFGRFRAQAKLRRDLAGADDHILRDIGLVRTGSRIESADVRNLWSRGDV